MLVHRFFARGGNDPYGVRASRWNLCRAGHANPTVLFVWRWDRESIAPKLNSQSWGWFMVSRSTSAVSTESAGCALRKPLTSSTAAPRNRLLLIFDNPRVDRFRGCSSRIEAAEKADETLGVHEVFSQP